MNLNSTVIRILASVLISLACISSGIAADLTSKLIDIARQQGVELVGLEQVKPDYLINPDPDSPKPLRQMLRDHDYVLIDRGSEQGSRLIIMGAKGPPPDPVASAQETEMSADQAEIVLPTQRQGQHHMLSATVQGPAGDQYFVRLMVDTGASLTTLPQSAAERIKLDMATARTIEIQTANGKTEARVSQIKQLVIGDLTLDQVEVAILPDQDLGGHGLLGMNVLGRYLFSLDDEKNQLLLVPDAK